MIPILGPFQLQRVDYVYADYLPFILCNEMDPKPSTSVEACLEKHLPQLDYSDILTCAQVKYCYHEQL